MENSAPLPEITNHETVDLAQRFIQIVAKPPQSRTPKQISTILEYVIINKALRQLSEKLSMKFVKNLLARHANLMCLGPKCLIAAEGDKIKNFYFVIQGTVVRYMKNGKKGIANNHKQDYNIYEKLGILAHKETKENNKLKKRKPVRRLSKQFDDDFHYFRRVNKNYLQSQLQEINLIGLEDRTLGLKYLHDIFTVDKGVLLEIPIQGFLSCLATYLDEKVQKLHDQIIHYPCFVGLDSEVVQSIIISLSEKRHRRGTYIYRQNQPVHSIYFLASGQVRLTKQSNLFVQNPNNLYANRISLMMEPNGQKLKARYQVKQEQMKKAEASLPYADLSLMFNYVPKKKVVQISKLHSFCIFGGQQLIESKKREANAICNSLEVIYYEISVVKLQQILGNKNMPIFVRGLKHEAKDKVLHRQSHFANTINFLNQKNLNYFYYEGEEQKKSHHKIRILKLNSKLEQRNTKLKERYLSLDQKVSVPPQYTAFNFHKLNSLTPIQSNLISRKKLNTVVNDTDIKNPESGQQNGNQSDDEIEDGVVPSTQQMKIMNMTHTWKLIKQKVDVEAIKSQKISPKKYTIDVNQPLIANKYFTQLDKQKRRVERQIRKDKITLGKSRASVLSHHKVPLNSW